NLGRERQPAMCTHALCCMHNNPTSPHRCPGVLPGPLSLSGRDRPDRTHELEELLDVGVADGGEAGQDDLDVRPRRRLAQVLPRRGEADEDASMVLGVRGLGDETSILELAQQAAESAAAEHHAAQQISVPDLLTGQAVDERVEFVECEVVPLTEAELELAHEVLVLLHHQPPGRDLDRPVLSDPAADRNRLVCPLVHARSVCPLPLFVATSTRLQFNSRSGSARRGLVDYPSTAVPGTSPPHPRHSRMT